MCRYEDATQLQKRLKELQSTADAAAAAAAAERVGCEKLAFRLGQRVVHTQHGYCAVVCGCAAPGTASCFYQEILYRWGLRRLHHHEGAACIASISFESLWPHMYAAETGRPTYSCSQNRFSCAVRQRELSNTPNNCFIAIV